ncbi:MAG: hypothetical protein AVDCRST_MAG77-3943 [uncultured Chloroflexi bacterium]|uniref:Uncharacterized protein n=1 Tax=uncultured Chloroflexota bacterium TaxID=166587 RepID=A0A6J4JMZ5_9CHLR|nr:MAG: hypothetical protein AVDCRST_MAG77-3943 [uncultured Chloroflexota bacterium]
MHAGRYREADERAPSGAFVTGPEFLVLQLLGASSSRR